MIAISSTTYDSHQAETVTITAVSDRTISFTPSLQHKHLGKQHSSNTCLFTCSHFLCIFSEIPICFCWYLVAGAFSYHSFFLC